MQRWVFFQATMVNLVVCVQLSRVEVRCLECWLWEGSVDLSGGAGEEYEVPHQLRQPTCSWAEVCDCHGTALGHSLVNR